MSYGQRNTKQSELARWDKKRGVNGCTAPIGSSVTPSAYLAPSDVYKRLDRSTFSNCKIGCFDGFGTAVEHKPHDQEVEVSNPDGAVFFSSLSNLNPNLSEAATLLIFTTTMLSCAA